MRANILLIGGSRVKETAHLAALERHYDVGVFSSGKQALEAARAFSPRAVVLDAASMGTTGERIRRALHAGLPGVPLVHIYPGALDDAAHDAQAVVRLAPPVSARKLISALQRLIVEDDEEIIDCGPFCMNVTRRVLVAYGKETPLTPKLALLVETFLRQPGQVIDRKVLMEKVWNTDYLGDTRTLDVHIRWIRQALEGDGSRPRHLKTVRGVGYRLEVPEPEWVR